MVFHHSNRKATNAQVFAKYWNFLFHTFMYEYVYVHISYNKILKILFHNFKVVNIRLKRNKFPLAPC